MLADGHANGYVRSTVAKQPAPAVFAGLPFSKLTGHYFDGESLAAFDPQTAVFRMDATFTGSGCTLLGTQPGSSQVTGTLSSSRLGHVVLVGFGIVGDRPASV